VSEDKILVKFNLKQSQGVTISLRDITGKTLSSLKSFHNKGENIVELPKSAVGGVYLISLQKNDGRVLTNKILL